MKEFVLILTLAVTGNDPLVIEADFSTRESCESARLAAQKEAALFAAHLRKTEKRFGEPIAIPQLAATCEERNSN